MAIIRPRFDFTTAVATVPDAGTYPLGRIPHEETRKRHNDLGPVKFTEYERCIVEVASAMGDYAFSAVVPGASDTVASAISQLWTLKLNLSGGTVTGATNFSTAAPVSFGASVTQTGTATSTSQDYTTNGRISARSLEVDWASSTLYRVGDLIAYDKRIYRCKTQHTSTASFVDDFADNWEVYSGGGSTTYDVNISPSTHSFAVGDVVRYNSDDEVIGYGLAQADFPETLALGMIEKAPNNENFSVIIAGYTDQLTGVTDDQGDSLVENTWYYLSPTVAGKVTKTQPSIVQPIFYTLAGTPPTEGYVVVPPQAMQAASAHVDSFTATAEQTSFSCSYEPVAIDYTLVSLDGVVQHEGSYTLSSGEVIFSSGIPEGTSVCIRYFANLNIQPGALVEEALFTATAGQTIFDLSVQLTYDPLGAAYINVSSDGLILSSNDFTLSGSTLTLTTPRVGGEKIRVQSLARLNIVQPGENEVDSQHIASGAIEWYHLSSGLVLEISPYSTNNYSVPSGETIGENILVTYESGCVHQFSTASGLIPSYYSGFGGNSMPAAQTTACVLSLSDEFGLQFYRHSSGVNIDGNVIFSVHGQTGNFDGPATTVTSGSVDELPSATSLSPTQALLGFKGDGGDAYVTLINVEEHTGVITAGNAVILEDVTSVSGIVVNAYTSTQVLAVVDHVDGGFLHTTVYGIDTSSGVPVIGTPADLETGSGTEWSVISNSSRLSDTTMLVTYNHTTNTGSTFTPKACIVSISGAEASVGPSTTLGSAAATIRAIPCNPACTSTMVPVCLEYSGTYEFVTCIIDGATITSVVSGDTVTRNAGSYGDVQSIVPYSNTLCIIGASAAGGIAGGITVWIGYYEGTEFKVSPRYLRYAGSLRTGLYSPGAILSSKQYVLSVMPDSSESADLVEFLIAPDYENIIGITTESALGPDTIATARFGRTTHATLTGLSPNTTYYATRDGRLSSTPEQVPCYANQTYRPLNFLVGQTDSYGRLKLDGISYE